MRGAKFLIALLTCALAAIAVVGAGTASATRLCSKNETVCPEARRWPSGTAIQAEATSPKFVTSLGTVMCNNSALEGKTTSVGGGTGVAVTAEITKLEYVNNCKLGITTCTITTNSLPYTGLEIQWTATPNGTMTINPNFLVTCGTALKCKFTAPGDAFEVKGAEAAQLVANELVLSREGGPGFICPTTAKWNATYVVSNPGPLYVSKE